jgi:hypothetical protein
MISTGLLAAADAVLEDGEGPPVWSPPPHSIGEGQNQELF